MSSVLDIVHLIQSKATLEDALNDCLAIARTKNLKRQWVISVFNGKILPPTLDMSINVHDDGVDVLNLMGISPETQTSMWTKWATLDIEIQADWVDGWKKVDSSDTQDVISYVTLLVNLLT